LLSSPRLQGSTREVITQFSEEILNIEQGLTILEVEENQLMPNFINLKSMFLVRKSNLIVI